MYHGSCKKFDVGFQLLPQNKYTSNDNSKALEDVFESVKPSHCISRKKAVFLSDDIDLIDAAGGYIDIIYKVDTIDYEKSDLAWYTKAQEFIEGGQLELAKKCAEKYWNGVPFYDSEQSCMEYRAETATITEIVEVNTPQEEFDNLSNDNSNFNILNSVIRNNIDFNKIDLNAFKWNVEQNLEYHSVRHDGNLTKDDGLELIFNKLLTHFIKNISELDNINGDKFLLYRAIGIESLDTLDPNLGKYWSFDPEKATIFDDEDYQHDKSNKELHQKYYFKAEVKLSDIDWSMTLDLYLMQEFDEAEIRLLDNSTFYNVEYKKTNDESFKKINLIKNKIKP
jgi:hypothetical protein